MAWSDGTNMRYCLRVAERETKLWMLKEVGALIREVDANKTLRDSDELTECCEAIIEEHPTLKIEEMKQCFTMIKRGKLLPRMFERLKTKDILDALRQYEGDIRAEMIERDHQATKVDPHKRSSDGQTVRDFLHLTEQDLLDLGQVTPRDTRNTDSNSGDQPDTDRS